jgi:hypothetical protein
MAGADYARCDVCGAKAFYDANITDDRYHDPIAEGGVDIAVICNECTKTHKVTVTLKEGQADAGQD